MDLVMCLGMSLCLYLVRACVWFSVSVSGSGSGSGGGAAVVWISVILWGASVFYVCWWSRGSYSTACVCCCGCRCSVRCYDCAVTVL